MKQVSLRYVQAFFVMVFCGGILGSGLVVHADESPVIPPDDAKSLEMPPQFDKALQKKAIATVNVQNVVLVKQEKNQFALTFDISNREGSQPKIIYAINVLQQGNGGQLTIADQKVYDDLLSLDAGESIHKEVSYIAPGYLQGQYILQVEVKSSDGLPLGVSQVQNPVMLDGTGQSIAIQQSNCFLTVSGEDAGKHYGLAQGTDIDADETLTAHCPVVSTFKTSQRVTPIVTIRSHSNFGKVMMSEKQTVFSLDPNQTMDIAFTIPKLDQAQLYNVTLTLTNDTSETLSQSAQFPLVVRGEKISIQNLSGDKDYYAAGSEATIAIEWRGIANNAVLARLAQNNSEEVFTVAFAMTDGQKKSCGQDINMPLNQMNQWSLDNFSFPVTQDCVNPIITASILDKDATVVAQKTVSIESAENPSASTDTIAQPMPPVARETSVWDIIIMVVGVGIIGYGTYFFRRKKHVMTKVLFGMLLGVSSLMYGQSVQADTFSSGALTVTANLNKSVYIEGESVDLSGSYTIAPGLWTTDNGHNHGMGYHGPQVIFDAEPVGMFRHSYVANFDYFYPTVYFSKYYIGPVYGNSLFENIFPGFSFIATKNPSSGDSEQKTLLIGAWTEARVPTAANIERGMTVSNWVTPDNGGNGWGSFRLPYTVISAAVNGVCGSVAGTCSSGSLFDVADESSRYLWNCYGAGGGSNAWCSACKVSSWGPDPSSQCSGVPFTQVSNCGTAQAAIGTGPGIWDNDPAEVCSQKTVNQKRCGEIRKVSGTKTCPIGKWNEIPPVK